MAIPNVTIQPTKMEIKLEKAVDALSELAQETLDAKWDNASQETMSKIHADILATVFLKLGRLLLKDYR